MWPKVSIFWINYNSEDIIDIVLESLNSVCTLDYPDYELIIVDNGSTDRSFKILTKEIENKCKVPKKIIKLERNRGFATANNIAFVHRDKSSKYICLINNDAVVYKNSLKELVERIENDEDNKVAAAQGIITNWRGDKVDNFGFIVNELNVSIPLYRGFKIEKIKKEVYCTFVSGAYSIYSVEALIHTTGDSKIFDGFMFAYYDDKILGMRLWQNKYRVKSYPVLAARHYGSASFHNISPQKVYLITRSFYVLNKVSRGRRYKNLSLIIHLLRQLLFILFFSGSFKNMKQNTYSLFRGLKMGTLCYKLIDYYIDFTQIPVKKTSLLDIFLYVVSFPQSLLKT